MTSKQYLQALTVLELGCWEAGELLGVAPSTEYRYANGKTRIPAAVAVVLRAMMAGKLTAADVRGFSQ